jgi:hypothetical protein
LPQDPLLPLFCTTAEEVLSRQLLLLVAHGTLSCISNGRTIIPSDYLFADDLMIFCKSTQRNAWSILQLFQGYGANSGQIISPTKCKFFVGALVFSTRLNSLEFFFLLPLSPKKLICLPLVQNYFYKCPCSSFNLASISIFSTSSARLQAFSELYVSSAYGMAINSFFNFFFMFLD